MLIFLVLFSHFPDVRSAFRRLGIAGVYFLLAAYEYYLWTDVNCEKFSLNYEDHYL